MNTSYKKTLLLALSLLAGNSLINAMLPNTTPEHYKRVRANALEIRDRVTQERKQLFKITAAGKMYLRAQDNIFSETQNPTKWISLADTINGLATNFPADRKTLQDSMTLVVNALGSLVITLDHHRQGRKDKLMEDVNSLKTSRRPGLLAAKKKLEPLFEKIITEKQKLEKQISDIKAGKGFYVSKDNRDKDQRSKEDRLVFVRAEEAVVELFLRYTLHTLTAIDRVIEDAQYVNLGAGVPVFPKNK
jgi:hypothetical protein